MLDFHLHLPKEKPLCSLRGRGLDGIDRALSCLEPIGHVGIFHYVRNNASKSGRNFPCELGLFPMFG